MVDSEIVQGVDICLYCANNSGKTGRKCSKGIPWYAVSTLCDFWQENKDVEKPLVQEHKPIRLDEILVDTF
jgi:hypothetical protein